MPVEFSQEFFDTAGWEDINQATIADQGNKDEKRLGVLQAEYAQAPDKSLLGDIKKQANHIGDFKGTPAFGGLDVKLKNVDYNQAVDATQNPINIEAIRVKDSNTPYKGNSSFMGDLSNSFKEMLGIGEETKKRLAPTSIKGDIGEGFVGGGAGIVKGVFRGLVSQKALDEAVNFAKNSSEHTLVHMSPDEFLGMAFPLNKTREELAGIVKEVPSIKELATSLVGRKEKIREYVKQGGVNSVPTMDISGGQVLSHEGRTRALIAKEMGLDTIPVMIKDITGKFKTGEPLHKRTLSEYGDTMMDTKELYKPILE